MNVFTRRLLIVVVLLLQAACGGLQNCSSAAVSSGLLASNWSQTCSASYAELTETQSVRISFDDITILSNQVVAEVRLTVESGTAQLTMLNGSNMPIIVTASAGQPGTYTGTASDSPGPSARFDLIPLGGTARNVAYEVRFSG